MDPWVHSILLSHPTAAHDSDVPLILQTATRGLVVAPVSGNNLGMRRAEIKPGVREIHLCKDERGKTGLRLRPIDQVGLRVLRRGGFLGGLVGPG